MTYTLKHTHIIIYRMNLYLYIGGIIPSSVCGVCMEYYE